MDKNKSSAEAIFPIFSELREEIRDMIQAVKSKDPAARNSAEILLLYSGVHALLAHRVAHRLYQNIL